MIYSGVYVCSSFFARPRNLSIFIKSLGPRCPTTAIDQRSRDRDDPRPTLRSGQDHMNVGDSAVESCRSMIYFCRLREVARVFLLSPVKSAQNYILCPLGGDGELLSLFSSHQPPKTVSTEAWSAPATHYQS